MVLSQQARHAAAKSYRISRQEREDWPSHSKELFERVRDLGNTNTDWWEEKYCEDSQYKWCIKTRTRAREISRLAESLKHSGDALSESDWRKMEQLMYDHLDNDPYCWTCSKRQWRSMVEVEPHMLQFETNLGQRQAARKACDCLSSNGNKPSRVFATTHERPVDYDENLLELLEKKRELPDVLIGLRQEGRVFHNMQGTRTKTGKTTLKRTGPFRNNYATCIFPFLIGEAKAAKSPDNSGNIESQVSFAIREMLLVQQELASLGKGNALAFEPLVWSITYHGEYCKVGAACLRWIPGKNGNSSGYGIDLIALWAGDLTMRDHALRLLLIIDYISDWARDIYRENVIARLEALVHTPYVPKIEPPTPRTVRSFNNDIRPINRSPSSTDSGSLNQQATAKSGMSSEASPDELRSLQHEKFAFRDARFIRSRVVGLFITPENISELCDPTKLHVTTTDLLGKIAIKLEKRNVAKIPGKFLSVMEEMWAGTPTTLIPSACRNEEFLVVFNFSAYFTSNWEPVQEMSYIAISTRAYPAVKQCRPPVANKTPVNITYLDEDRCKGIVRSFLHSPLPINTLACILRCSLRPVYSSPGQANDLVNIFERNEVLKPTWMVPDKASRPIDLVWQIYSAHLKAGVNLEHKTSIRVMSLLEEQDVGSGQEINDGMPWGLGKEATLSGFVLLQDQREVTWNAGQPYMCLLKLNPKSLEELSWPLTAQEIEQSYQTTRYDAGKPWDKLDWNRAVGGTNDGAVEIYKGWCTRALYSAYAEHAEKSKSSIETHLEKALSKLSVGVNNELTNSEEDSDQSEGISVISSLDSHDPDMVQFSTPPSSCRPLARKKKFSLIRQSHSMITGDDSSSEEDPLQSPSRPPRRSLVNRNTKSTLPRYLQILASPPTK